jgi:hypothetical protein
VKDLNDTLDILKKNMSEVFLGEFGKWMDEGEHHLKMVFAARVDNSFLNDYHCYLMFDFATFNFKGYIGSFKFGSAKFFDELPLDGCSATFDDLDDLYMTKNVDNVPQEALEALKGKVFMFVRKVLFDCRDVGSISEDVLTASMNKLGFDDFFICDYSGGGVNLVSQKVISGDASSASYHALNVHSTINVNSRELNVYIGESKGAGFSKRVSVVDHGLAVALKNAPDDEFKALVLVHGAEISSMITRARMLVVLYPWSIFVDVESNLAKDGDNTDAFAIDRNKLASDLFVALIANPERYKYITEKVESGQLGNNEATAKNINKAFKLADQFIEQAKRLASDS